MKRLRDFPYFYMGVTALCVLCGCILFNTVLAHLNVVFAMANKLFAVLTPFVWGFVISYLLLPLVRTFEYRMFNPLLEKALKRELPNGGFPRGISIAMALITAGFLIFVLIWVLLPTVYESIQSIYLNYSIYLNNLIRFINGLFEDNPELAAQVEDFTRNVSNEVVAWINEKLLPTIGGLLSDVTGVLLNLTSGMYRLVTYVLDILIGGVISCYVLYNREKFAATWKRLLYALFGVRRSEKIQQVVHFANEAFMGFLVGKIIDSSIIGCLTYVCCEVLDMPYPAFIAIIVGVTNIIPIFGPFIGAVPCGIIILMVNPSKLLAFLLMIFVIQQIDGNIIGPKILGNSVGINGFWIMFAIIVMGDLFGVPGMIIGVPLFVVLTAGFEGLLTYGLKKRGLATDASLYVDMSHIDPSTGVPVHKAPKQMTVGKKTPNTPDKSGESGE